MNKSTEEKSGDAIDLLKSDHREVEKAFAQFEKLADDDHSKKKELADHICDELLIHMSIEEEIFYPAVKDGKGLDEIVNEGVVEHAGAKVLIKQIKSMKGDEELFDTKVMVLAEQIEHHVKEEENEMFPKVKSSKVDTAALGQKIARRKSSLM